MKVLELIQALSHYNIDADVTFHLSSSEEMEILSIYSENEDEKDLIVFFDLE